jgi:N-acyl homoserine lactone hydrolase
LVAGVNVGVPIELSDDCYLIHHARGWFLWDTGLPDVVAVNLDGVKVNNPNALFVLKRTKRLAAQLADAPTSNRRTPKGWRCRTRIPITSATSNLFPQVMLYVQKAEYEWPGKGGEPMFSPDHLVTKLDDEFGDGSVMIISMPGHTPGHQSLRVRLPKTGVVVLSGDAAHVKDNWDNRRVPAFNFNKAQALASMQRITDLLARSKCSFGSITTRRKPPRKRSRRNSTIHLGLALPRR